MKKLLALVLAILLTFIQYSLVWNSASALSPSIQIKPAIIYESVNYDDSWWALMNDNGYSVNSLAAYLNEYFLIGACSFDYAMWLICDHIYENVTFTFQRTYYSCEQVCMLLMGDQEHNMSYLWGIINEDGSVTFNLEHMEPDIYCAYIFSGYKKP